MVYVVELTDDVMVVNKKSIGGGGIGGKEKCKFS
jgi:hypothetical protein